MDKQRTRRLLLVAFALSLLIHVLLAYNLHWRWVTPVDSTQVTVIHVVKPVRIARVLPTPPPTPAPTPRPAPAVSAPLVSRVKGSGTGPGGGASPPPVASPTPPPVVSPTPDCSKLDIPAQIAQTPPPPDLSGDARASAASGTARVRVQLDADGAVIGTAVLNSSGSTALDDVAVGLARNARYAPATHQCKTVASYYDFTAKFSPW